MPLNYSWRLSSAIWSHYLSPAWFFSFSVSFSVSLSLLRLSPNSTSHPPSPFIPLLDRNGTNLLQQGGKHGSECMWERKHYCSSRFNAGKPFTRHDNFSSCPLQHRFFLFKKDPLLLPGCRGAVIGASYRSSSCSFEPEKLWNECVEIQSTHLILHRFCLYQLTYFIWPSIQSVLAYMYGFK